MSCATEQHTAAPWIAVDGDMREIEITTQDRIDNSFSPICEMDVDYTGQMGVEQKANAAFIVRACNAHDDLVKALQEIALNDPFNQSSAGIIARAALYRSRAA